MRIAKSKPSPIRSRWAIDRSTSNRTSGKQVDEEAVAERCRRGDAQQSVDFGAHRRNRPFSVGEEVTGLACVVEVQATGIRERDAPCGAMEQADSECRFQFADLLADVGLGQPQALGRAGEAAGLHDREEAQGLIETAGECFHG